MFVCRKHLYKQKLFKILCCKAMVLSLFLCLFLISGCNKKELTGSERYKEELIIDVFDPLANSQGIQTGWFAKIVKDKFNMELNIIAPNVSGGGDTLYRTRAAAGNLGDIVIVSSQDNNLQDMVDAGLIIDMKDYLKGQSIMQYEDAIRSLNNTVDNKAIYAIPSEISSNSCMYPIEANDPTFGPYLRYDLYAAAGYPVIRDLQGLLAVLAKMQEIHPVSESGRPTYAFSFFKDWDGNMMNNAKQPACFYGYDEFGFVLAKADGSDYQDITANDSFYMRNLKLYFDANQMGLVDPDSPNQSYWDVYKKYAAGDIFYSPWPWLGSSAYNTLSNKNIGKGFMFIPIEDMKILLYGCTPTGNDKAVIAIGKNAKDPQRMADFINWLYSPEGIYANSAQALVGTAGPENMTWEMTADGPVLTDLGKEAFLNGDTEIPEEYGGGTWMDGRSFLNYNAVTLVNTASNGYPYLYTRWPSYINSEDTTLDLSWKNHMKASSALDYLMDTEKYVISPGGSYYNSTEDTEITSLRRGCKRVIVDTSWKMIFAKDEEEFYSLQKQMQDTLKGLGYETVLEYDMEDAKNKIEAKLNAAKAERISND